jgi:uncharacterized repeat protein (TIGR01451 family)
LDKAASAETVFPGENITYTLSVSHPHGAAADTNVVLTDTIPTGTTFISATAPYTITGETIVWQFPTLEVSGTIEVELAVQVGAGTSGVISNQEYAVASDQSATVWGEAVNTPVEGLASLELSKSASVSMVFPGDLITYTLTITNESETVGATNVVLTDTLPMGSSFVSATSPFTRGGDIIRWEITSLDALGSLNVQLVVAVDPNASGAITNQDYAVWADQAVREDGEPVSTPVGWWYLPLVVSNR